MDVDEFNVILESNTIVFVLLGFIVLTGIIIAIVFIVKSKKSKKNSDEVDEKKAQKDKDKKDEKV